MIDIPWLGGADRSSEASERSRARSRVRPCTASFSPTLFLFCVLGWGLS